MRLLKKEDVTREHLANKKMSHSERYHEYILQAKSKKTQKHIRDSMPSRNPHSPNIRLIRPYGTHYQVARPNPLFPDGGDVWFQEGRLYSLKGIRSLISQNDKNLCFIFQIPELEDEIIGSERIQNQEHNS